MNIGVKEALARTFDAVGDKWEKQGVEFFQKIAAGYELCASLPMLANTFFTINAHGERDEIFERICRLVTEKTGL